MSFLIPFDFHKGDRLDGMTIVKTIVHGGHGDLYLVRGDDGEHLVLKVIRKADNEDEVNGIEHCRSVVSHIPGLVPILRTGRLDDGRFYCVMPPADNLAAWPDYEPDTLANRIRIKGRLRPDEALKIAENILSVTGDLHSVSLAHCDIKPENILFINGKPELADYSLLSDTINRPAGSAGTVGFIPPEMLDNPGCYDPVACDLYAIGKLIYGAWTGSDVVFFPSVPKSIELQEIGIMRPLYMKACSVSPNGRFKNADEFKAAVSDARSRLDRSIARRVRSGFRNALPVLLFVLLILLCVLGLVNLVFFIQLKSGKGERGGEANAAPDLTGQLRSSGSPGDAETIEIAFPPDPLVVTTDSDVVDANDGVTSLREAFDYAQRHGAGATVSFARDCEIKLSSALSVTQNVIIDGGGNRITLIGPETEPMFRVTESRLTLKNLSLISDYTGDGGGILDAGAPGHVVLSCIKDGGKAECFWCISGKCDLDLEDGSHLHHVQVKPQSGGGNIRIKAGAVLEELAFSGDSRNMGEGNCDVNGLLKNSSVADRGDIYVNPGGVAENITVKKNGFLDVRPGGTIDGVKVDFGGIMGYMDKSIVTGTVSISGVAWEPYGPNVIGGTVDGVQAFPVIDGGKTDIVFDLTERTEDSRSWFSLNVEVRFSAIKNLIEGPEATRLLFNDLASFLGARSCTIRVGDDQPAGTYLLGTQADKFDSAVSLVIGDKVYRDALVIGKQFSVGGKNYKLVLDYWESRSSMYLTNYEVRTLMLEISPIHPPAQDNGAK